MKRKRIKKLLMSVGIQRNEAEILARKFAIGGMTEEKKIRLMSLMANKKLNLSFGLLGGSMVFATFAMGEWGKAARYGTQA